jgi:hypothetical protein
MTGVRRLLACLVVGPMVGLMATSCSSGTSTTDPKTLVSEAKATLDATPGLHFTLSSANTPSKGTVLTGGNGDVARPASFQGTLHVQRSGLQLSVDVVSVNGKVRIRLPLTNTYVTADPHSYGFSDPGKLLDPQSGITGLLSQATDVKSAGRDRYNGEKLEEVAVTIPGTAVADVLTSADKTQPVHGTLGINPSNHQLRRAVLTGPFLDKNVQTTFTIVLDNYGEHPTIRDAG